MTRSTVMYLVGIVMALGAAAAMLWSPLDAAPLMVFGVIGLVFIAVGARDRRRHQS